MSNWTFNPPPGWPEQPEGWIPPPGWTPDPSWPPPPAGWQFWIPAGQRPASAPPPVSPAAAPGSPAGGPPGAQPGQPYSGAGNPPGGSLRWPAPSHPHWATQWWGILGLVGALLVGGLLGFGGTNLALAPTPTPEPTPPGWTEQPGPTPPGRHGADVCEEVTTVMAQLSRDHGEAADMDDPIAALAGTQRAAADLRHIDTDDGAAREALDTFADELDAAADDFEPDPAAEADVSELAERTSSAWTDFNDTTGC